MPFTYPGDFMKKLIFSFALLIFVLSAQAAIVTRTCTDKKTGMKVEIESRCPMPTEAREDTGSKTVSVTKRKSFVKIYKNNKLLSSESFTCSGIQKEDRIIFVTIFENENTEVIYGVLDDFGMEYAMWVDVINKQTQDEYRLNCLR